MKPPAPNTSCPPTFKGGIVSSPSKKLAAIWVSRPSASGRGGRSSVPPLLVRPLHPGRPARPSTPYLYYSDSSQCLVCEGGCAHQRSLGRRPSRDLADLAAELATCRPHSSPDQFAELPHPRACGLTGGCLLRRLKWPKSSQLIPRAKSESGRGENRSGRSMGDWPVGSSGE